MRTIVGQDEHQKRAVLFNLVSATPYSLQHTVYLVNAEDIEPNEGIKGVKTIDETTMQATRAMGIEKLNSSVVYTGDMD